MTLPFMYNFRSPYDFLKSNFSHFTPQVRLFFFYRERKPKIFGIENAMQRGIRKNYHFRKTLNCSLNFRENNTEALVISERFKLP